MLGGWLDLMILEVFSNLNDSMILWVTGGIRRATSLCHSAFQKGVYGRDMCLCVSVHTAEQLFEPCKELNLPVCNTMWCP